MRRIIRKKNMLIVLSTEKILGRFWHTVDGSAYIEASLRYWHCMSLGVVAEFAVELNFPYRQSGGSIALCKNSELADIYLAHGADEFSGWSTHRLNDQRYLTTQTPCYIFFTHLHQKITQREHAETWANNKGAREWGDCMRAGTKHYWRLYAGCRQFCRFLPL